MANIIEEFLDKREYAFTKDIVWTTDTLKVETYSISGDETIDGLKLRIMVYTAYMNDIPFAQDFEIRSNRGAVHKTSVNEIFEVLRMFL